MYTYFIYKAEESIRGLLLSRGLGDVYGRQAWWDSVAYLAFRNAGARPELYRSEKGLPEQLSVEHLCAES